MWRAVVGYEGIYEVSSNGEIRTTKGKTTYSTHWNTERHWDQRILKLKVDKDNSTRVTLYRNGKPKTLLVHRLVAKAFLPEIEGKEYINHKDGSRLNNEVSNLEWCNHTENNNHAFDNNLIRTADNVTLINKETNQQYHFRSKAKASEFLGKNKGFLSRILLKGMTEYEDFIILTNVA